MLPHARASFWDSRGTRNRDTIRAERRLRVTYEWFEDEGRVLPTFQEDEGTLPPTDAVYVEARRLEAAVKARDPRVELVAHGGGVIVRWRDAV